MRRLFPAPACQPAPEPAPAPVEAAPRAEATPGTPSPEALARLQAAVRRSPEPRDAPVAPRQMDHAPQATEERPRFGINSLIGRMTGHNGEGGERAQPQIRRQPPVQAEPDEPELSQEEERIEIPAFLRRQAN